MFKKFYFFLGFFLSIFSFIYNPHFSDSYHNNSNYLKPIKSNLISSYFGYRDLYGKTNFHDGIDFPAPPNTNVYATQSGVVINSSFINGYGNTVTILHQNGTKSLYGHLSETFFVYNGQTVSQGQLIGKVGPKYLSDGRLNGFTTGPHLHFTVFNQDGKQIDPLSLNLQEIPN